MDSGHTLRSPARTPCVPPHRYHLFLLNHIVKVSQRALQLPAIDRLGGFASVLEGDAEVGAASTRGLGGFDLGGCVADLDGEGWKVSLGSRDGEVVVVVHW